MAQFRYRPSKFYLFTFSRVYATSRHIPGVRFAGISHPGLIGTAPSSELLATWNKREGALIAEHLNSVPPVAFPPEPIGAYVGQEIGKDVMEKVANEGARTIPGREHGGNCDVSLYSCFFRRFCGRMCSWLVFWMVRLRTCRGNVFLQLSWCTFWLWWRGSRCYFPVFVKGANLSVGDLHFSQGDVSWKNRCEIAEVDGLCFRERWLS